MTVIILRLTREIARGSRNQMVRVRVCLCVHGKEAHKRVITMKRNGLTNGLETRARQLQSPKYYIADIIIYTLPLTRCSLWCVICVRLFMAYRPVLRPKTFQSTLCLIRKLRAHGRTSFNWNPLIVKFFNRRTKPAKPTHTHTQEEQEQRHAQETKLPTLNCTRVILDWSGHSSYRYTTHTTHTQTQMHPCTLRNVTVDFRTMATRWIIGRHIFVLLVPSDFAPVLCVLECVCVWMCGTVP